MSPEELREMSDLAKLRIHEYFDHYLTDTFPAQMRGMFAAHNADIGAHQAQFRLQEKTCLPGRKINRVMWMVAGGVAVISGLCTIGAERILKLIGLI
jgi:hypothetical protein